MNINLYITSSPGVCHGRPCFKRSRIMVHQVLEMLSSGETPREIIRNAYPSLTLKHIQAALIYAAGMAREGHQVSLTDTAHALSRR